MKQQIFNFIWKIRAIEHRKLRGIEHRNTESSAADYNIIIADKRSIAISSENDYCACLVLP